ncbi:McrB family protein [Alkanindiges sp. WGS2144]|uniref:McrB family protein n=1 Tax=Alkanindiges sp. WGS2144 TaxID=3366808 RepID=UPI0037533478
MSRHTQGSVAQQAVNQIFYGTPGTGKTWHLQQLQKQYTEQLAQQDQHTFMAEKLRDLSWAEVICLVFLEEKRLLRVPEILNHPLMRCKVKLSNRKEHLSQTIWATLMRHSSLDSRTVKYNPDKRSSLALFDKDEAGLWFLLPSAHDDINHLAQLLKTIERGAQAAEVIQRYSFVTFHQSYSYEDFIEGLRPVLDDEENSQIRYEIKPGVLVELCERARLDPTHAYALFIDEVNRGNVSKIFGELISLLELDKRQGKPGQLEVVLPYSRRRFSVPANVSIYATMNSADRSLVPLDHALRRRFEFIEMLPNYELLQAKTTANDLADLNLAQLLATINNRIELLIGRDYLLGHAFFCVVHDFADLQQVMQQKIIPLLQEYFFDDWQKIRLVLNDHRKPHDLQFIQQKSAEQQATQLFGELPDMPVQSTYYINQAALSQLRAYQLIC